MNALSKSVVVGCILLAGCASAPVYRPAPTPNDYGYRTTALADARFRISFAGGYDVARETVENLALFRAAQVALAHGARRLRVISSDTTTVSDYAGPAATLSYGPGFWTTGFMLAHGDPEVRYETVLEIVIGAQVPQQGAHVYDALALKRHLAALANGARH